MIMMKKLDTNEQHFFPEEAERVAKEMKASDPDWDYVVCHDPKGTGQSFIKIYDEDGEFVSKL